MDSLNQIPCRSTELFYLFLIIIILFVCLLLMLKEDCALTIEPFGV